MVILNYNDDLDSKLKKQFWRLLEESKELAMPDDGFGGFDREQRYDREKRRKERVVRVFKSVYGEDYEVDPDYL